MRRHLVVLRRSGLVALAALALLTAVAGTGLLIYREYQKTSDDAQRGATKIASLLASDIGGRLYAVDAALTDIGLDVERFLLLRDVRSAAQMEAAREDLLIQLVRRANSASEIESIAVIGVDRHLDILRIGAWPDDAPTESAYFHAFVADRRLRFHVDLPRPDRWSGALSAVVAHRFDAPGGEFGGIVAARVPLRVFASGLVMTQLNAHDVISVWRDDGYLVARFPDGEPFVGQHFGNIEELRPCLTSTRMIQGRFVSPLNQRDYFGACGRIGSLPLSVLVGIDAEGAIGEWRAASLWIALELIAVAIMIIWLAVRAGRRYAVAGQLVDESRELLRSALDTLPAIVSVKGADQRYKLVNRAFCDVLGVRPEDCIGRRYAEIAANPAHGRMVEIAEQAAHDTGSDHSTTEWSLARPDGTSAHFITFRRTRRDASGRMLDIISASVDVTSMRAAQARLAESEHLLQTILDAIPVNVVVKDERTRFVMLNRAAREFFEMSTEAVRGLTSREAIAAGVGRPSTNDGDGARRLAEIERTDGEVLATGRPVEPFEVTRTLRDGGIRTHLMHKLPLSDGDGTTRGIVIVSVDVTELKQSQRAAFEAKEMAELANRTKTEFLANMSHELRTPLNAVIGFGQMMENQVFGALGHERYRDYARHVVESGNHLLSLIGDILDVSSIDLGRVELSEEPVALTVVARTCLMMLRDKAVAGGVALQVAGVEGLPALRGDRRRLLQILVNLVGNAIKFTPTGGHVRIGAGLEADGSLRLAVTDTGIGMAPPDIETALEPFKQIESVFVRRHGGAGLGLPISRHLAMLHGAAFQVRSAPGAGTTVEIRFPPSRVLASEPAPRRA